MKKKYQQKVVVKQNVINQEVHVIIRINNQIGISNYMRSSNQYVVINQTVVIVFDLCAQTSHNHYMYLQC